MINLREKLFPLQMSRIEHAGRALGALGLVTIVTALSVCVDDVIKGRHTYDQAFDAPTYVRANYNRATNDFDDALVALGVAAGGMALTIAGAGVEGVGYRRRMPSR